MSNYRIVGQWAASRQTFLVTLGDCPTDCVQRLPTALSDYTREDVFAIESIWLEYWIGHRWEPQYEIHMGQIRRAKSRAA